MCDERERLIGFVYDECDPEEQRVIARHLEECADCRDEIGGLRATRQDLLAWQVEGEPAVWRPFVAPAVAPWYRQIPGWALAAAATIMFAIGAAGGVVTHAWLAPAESTATVAVAPASAPDLSSVEERLLARMRAELAMQATATAAMPRQAELVPVHLMQDVNRRLTDSEQRSQQLMLDFYREWANSTRFRDSEMREIKSKVAQFEAFLETQGGR